MPKGPQGQKRPADAVARAVMVAKIATGEIKADEFADTALHQKAGKKGGAARARSLTAEQRAEIARLAADARWKKS